MVVVEPEREPHALDRGLARRADEHGAVGQLPRLCDFQPSVVLIDGSEEAAGYDSCCIAAVPGRESEGVGAARSERRLDQRRVRVRLDALTCAA